MRVAAVITLSARERSQLERMKRGRSSSIRNQERAAIVLLAAEGLENKEIAARLNQDKMKVGRWRGRYAKAGLAGILKDKSRPGRIAPVAASTRSRIVEMTLEEKPPGATHWSRASMAKATGVSPSTVGRIWAAHGLKPHRVSSFKLSNDKRFQEKLEDIVGLYLNPPEYAIVFSCDEKSQIQALDRTQPGLPLKKGRCQTMTHDYKRNGTTSLFAAMNTLSGEVIGACMKKHRHQEWIRFLNLIRKNAPAGKQIHIICDNYATHKHEKVKAWFRRNPRFHVHYTPTSASWLNMVERFFRDLTVNSIRRGVFRSVEEVTHAINQHIAAHNDAPKPFIWTAKACDILEKVKRGRDTLNNMQSA
ncbi:MAG TPA: IS630 family transposase [Terrimicrobiaceae bacterium]